MKLIHKLNFNFKLTIQEKIQLAKNLQKKNLKKKL